jgi:transglutaminase-like putative cysteine protease
VNIATFAAAARDAAGSTALDLLHVILARLHKDMIHDTAGRTTVTAAEAFARKDGGAEDLAHIFIAAARSLAIPARYVAGYVRRDGGTSEQDNGHAWAEAFVPELGWVAFDAANGVCATDAHVRVAVGLDSLGAAPLRGTRYGGAGEQVLAKVRVEQAAHQVQG